MDNDDMECVVMAIIGCIIGVALAVCAIFFVGMK